MMGPPGAGKGTQAKFVAEHFGIPAISTGDIFRANVTEGTALGLEAKRYMDAGEYVPDEVTNLMVRNRIDEDDATPGFLLDGYPRTLAQVEELDGMIKFTGHSLDAVVVLTVDPDEIVQRLLQRAQVRDDRVELALQRQGPLAILGLGDDGELGPRLRESRAELRAEHRLVFGDERRRLPIFRRCQRGSRRWRARRAAAALRE